MSPHLRAEITSEGHSWTKSPVAEPAAAADALAGAAEPQAVNATFVVTCRYGGNSDTWDGRKGSPDAAAAWARRTASGGVECFTPDVFSQGEEQLRQQLEKMTKDMPSKKK
jgi:hypothetical protein